MEPVTKTLTCPGCAQSSAVKVMPGSTEPQRWHCPHCKKIQTSPPAAIDSAPLAG